MTHPLIMDTQPSFDGSPIMWIAVAVTAYILFKNLKK